MISLIGNLRNKTIISLIFLILVTIFFRSLNLNKLYSFDWDQERDANIVSNMIQDKKPVLIGPRVVNDSGFFVGPFHYYFLLPFYLITNSNPYAGAYAALLVEILTMLTLYLVTLKIFSPKVAFISAFIYSLSPYLVSWNVMYTPIYSIIIFYLCYLLLSNNFRIFPLLIFILVFAANNHPAFLSLIIPIFIAYFLSTKKLSPKIIIITLLISFIPFIPLILFDLRHEFINTKSVINFITTPKTVNTTNPFLFLRSFWRSFNILIIPPGIFLIIERVIIIIFSFVGLLSIKNRKIKILIVSWIMTPLLLLSLYKGDIPEYYYTAALILIPILLAIFFSQFISAKYIPILIIFLLIFQYLNIPKDISGAPSLKNKLAAVTYIVTQKEDPNFNVSYDLPLGMNSGYNYLFKYLGSTPQDNPGAHLYSIFIITKTPPAGTVVYQDNILGVVRK